MDLFEKYRQPWESDEHWNLRLEFLSTHWDNLPENRLLCLAQAYVNIELLGCTYPETVMRRVNELSEDLSKNKSIRESRQKKAQIKFVKGSDSIVKSARKGKKSTEGSASTSSSSLYSNFVQSSKSSNTDSRSDLGEYSRNQNASSRPNFVNFVPFQRSESPNTGVAEKTSFVSFVRAADSPGFCGARSRVDPSNGSCGQNNYPSNKRTGAASFFEEETPVAKYSRNNTERPFSVRPSRPVLDHRLAKFYELSMLLKSNSVFGKNALEKLQKATSQVGLKILWSMLPRPNKFECKVYMDDVFMGAGEGSNHRNARITSYENVLQKLKGDEFQLLSSETEVGELELVSKNTTITPTFYNSNVPAPLKEFVLIDNRCIFPDQNAISVICSSAGLNGIPFKFEISLETKGSVWGHKCEVLFAGQCIAEAFSTNKAEVKLLAATNALNYLQTLVPTIRAKPRSEASKMTKVDLLGSSEDSSNKALSEDNVGHRLLRMMGWSGGGVGKEGNIGIVEPVMLKDTTRREGLGFSGNVANERNFTEKIKELLSEFSTSNILQDLSFSPEFTKEERKIIHNISARFGLKTVSRGASDARYLTVSHKLRPRELLTALMKSGNSSDRHEAIFPSQSR